MRDRTLLRYLNAGYVTCWTLIIGQVLIALIDASRLNGFYFWFGLKVLNSLLSLSSLFILWRILVRYYDQHQLSSTFLMVFASLFLLLLFAFLSPERLIESVFWTGWLVVALVYLVVLFVLFFKIMEIDNMAVPKIELLKNYIVATVVCLFLVLVQFLVTRLLRTDEYDFLKPVFIIIPWIFLSVFFRETKRSLLLQ